MFDVLDKRPHETADEAQARAVATIAARVLEPIEVVEVEQVKADDIVKIDGHWVGVLHPINGRLFHVLDHDGREHIAIAGDRVQRWMGGF